jgi:predicted nucleic acid-binding protein
LETQETLFPSDSAVPFDADDARLAAKLYKSVKRGRTREADLAIAACAIRHGAAIWTLNPTDFSDIPGLKLFTGA